jgi:hypothetical protein
MKRSIVVAALVALTAAPVLTAAPALADATGDVRAAMLRFASLKSYEMTAGSGAHSMTMDVVNPGALRMRGAGMEMVRIGTTMYMKMPGQSKWMTTSETRGGTGTEMADKVRSLATDPKGMAVRDLGMRNADGQNMHAYEMTQKDGDKAVVYIGGDGYIHRLDPKSGRGGAEPIRFSKFNGIAAIRAPM